MTETLLIIIVVTISNLQLSVQHVTSYTGKFNQTDYEEDIGAEDHIIKVTASHFAQGCFSQCVSDCRCVSYQMSGGDRCELLSEDKTTSPNSFKPKPGYKYFRLNQTLKQQQYPSGSCSNGCCGQKPCLNGGVCTEQCSDAKRKFVCSCPSNYGGKACEIPPSCDKLPQGSPSGIYTIMKSPDRLKVYCDFTSEPGFVWTLIESFAFDSAIRSLYFQKPFYQTFPRNELIPTWNDYRLSLGNMQHIDQFSSHWRATCMFESRGLKYDDYIRVSKANQPLLQQLSARCIQYEYISVRNISCKGCTGYFRSRTYHAFVDSTRGKYLSTKCQWDGTPGAKIVTRDWGDDGEENFGTYEVFNPLHMCSSSNTATTNYWLGKKL